MGDRYMTLEVEAKRTSMETWIVRKTGGIDTCLAEIFSEKFSCILQQTCAKYPTCQDVMNT